MVDLGNGNLTIENKSIPSNEENLFNNKIKFYTPGFKSYSTSEYQNQQRNKFISISTTGTNCALNCEHCKTNSLKGMIDLPNYKDGLFNLCRQLADDGTKGILLSGGSDKRGRVPLLKYIPDLIRVKQELKLSVSVHPGLPDEETCAELAKVNLDSVMLDIIGDEKTVKEIYHLNKKPSDYEDVLERLEKYNLPAIPHILLGHYFGEMSSEYEALEMVKRHKLKMLVLLVMMPIPGTKISVDKLPSFEEINEFFIKARNDLPNIPIILGCARPMGDFKQKIDRAAIDAGLNGIAFPAEGIVQYVSEKNFDFEFIDSCCGVIV